MMNWKGSGKKLNLMLNYYYPGIAGRTEGNHEKPQSG
jgi:hypothetical protein